MHAKKLTGYSGNRWLVLILPLLGFAFWFLIAFPMGNRNESYIWIAYLQHFSLSEIIQTPIPSIRGHRPLAQAVSWCLYHLSGGNGVLVQLASFLMLSAAIGVIVSLTPKDKAFSVRFFYLLIGLIYFSAFYYIFNFHGIFYSVILLFVAMMLKAGESVVSDWKKWFPASLLLALFHPLILVLFLAFIGGWMLESKRIGPSRIAFFVLVLLLSIALLKVAVPFRMASLIDIRNLVGTMNNVERHAIVKIFTLALCLLPLRTPYLRQRILFLSMILVYTPLAILYDLPFLLLLGSFAIATLVMMRKWSIALLLAAALFFPLAVGSGAPTKASVFLFLLPPALLTLLPRSHIRITRMTNALCLSILGGIVLCASMIRMEAEIPILSRLVRPLLVEKGKSYQLESAIALAAGQIPPRRILFLQQKDGNIRDRGQREHRDTIPPTKQKELDIYQQFQLPGDSLNRSPVWYMAFGTEMPNDTLVMIRSLDERNCKPAYLYERVKALPVAN